MEQILYPYKNALWALRPAKPSGVLSRHPCRNPTPLPRGKGLYYWGYRPVQARTLAVSRTKSLHDAVTQMADDLYGGFAPATPFSKKYRFFDRLSRRAICTAAFCTLFGYGYRVSVFYLAHNCVLITRQHSYAASV